MTFKETYNSIDQTQLPEKAKKYMEDFKNDSNNFKDEEAMAKMLPALNKFIDALKKSGYESAIKTPEAKKEEKPKREKKEKVVKKTPVQKTKEEVEKAVEQPKTEKDKPKIGKLSKGYPMQLAKEIRKEGESWGDAMKRARQMINEQKQVVKKEAERQYEKLKRYIRLHPEVYPKDIPMGDGSKRATNLKRDIVREALPKGKRISKSGKKYYEYRSNRYDTRKKYPYLADGGEIEHYEPMNFHEGDREMMKSYSKDGLYQVKGWQDEGSWSDGNSTEFMRFNDLEEAKYWANALLDENSFGWYATEVYDTKDGETIYHSEGEYAKGGEIEYDSMVLKYDYPKYRRKPATTVYLRPDLSKVIKVGGRSEDGYHLIYKDGNKSSIVITQRELDELKNGATIESSGATVTLSDKYAKGGAMGGVSKKEHIKLEIVPQTNLGGKSIATKEDVTSLIRAYEKSDKLDYVDKISYDFQNDMGYAIITDKSKISNFINVLDAYNLQVSPYQTYAKGGSTDEVMIGDFKKNILGTLSFNLKLLNMRKSQDFSVYPVSEKSDYIDIQSATRFGKIQMTTGRGLMTQSHPNGAYAVHMHIDKLVKFTLTESQLDKLKEELAKTAGSSVGSSVIKSDNTYADKFAKGGYVEEGEDYEYVNTFGIDQDDFEKLVDAYHKSPSYDQAERVESRLIFRKMREKYGESKVDEVGNYIHETHESHEHYAKGGAVDKKEWVRKWLEMQDINYLRIILTDIYYNSDTIVIRETATKEELINYIMKNDYDEIDLIYKYYHNPNTSNTFAKGGGITTNSIIKEYEVFLDNEGGEMLNDDLKSHKAVLKQIKNGDLKKAYMIWIDMNTEAREHIPKNVYKLITKNKPEIKSKRFFVKNGKVMVEYDYHAKGGMFGAGHFAEGGEVKKDKITLIFNGKEHHYPIEYIDNQVEDVELKYSMVDNPLWDYLESEFYDWLEHQSRDYEEMYFGEEAIYDVKGAIRGAIEVIDEVIYEEAPKKTTFNLDKGDVDFTTAFQ